jgi:hypothetical protein
MGISLLESLGPNHHYRRGNHVNATNHPTINKHTLSKATIKTPIRNTTKINKPLRFEVTLWRILKSIVYEELGWMTVNVDNPYEASCSVSRSGGTTGLRSKVGSDPWNI